MKKRSYPNDDSINMLSVRDTQKWLDTIKSIYNKTHNGEDRMKAIKETTKDWSPMEVYDFLNWLKFYEEGTHMKYKVAQWYENGNPGYFLPIKPDAPAPKQEYVSGNDIASAKEEIESGLSQKERKDLIERQRHKIIGRLDSTEKLLRSNEGQLFAGKEYESLIEAIYSLKKKVHLINKLTLSSKIYDDILIREGNVLSRNGFVKAAQVLYKLADDQSAVVPAPVAEEPLTATEAPEEAATTPPATPVPAPTEGGIVGDIGSGMDIPGNTPTLGPNDGPGSGPNDLPKGILKFLENLDVGSVSSKEDMLEVSDQDINEANFDDVLEVEDRDGVLISEAQEVPPAPVVEPAETVVEDAPLEVSEEDATTDGPKIPKNPSVSTLDLESNKAAKYDEIIDMAFKNLTIDDIIAKAEDLAKIFSTREVPRQLFILDLMMDRLGLASYFPSLSEAINKGIDSNNYISSRIDDILSKLRGNVKTNDIDLRNGGGSASDSPELQAIKQNLKDTDEKEKAKKELRKKQENEAFDLEKETPEIDVENDLAAEPVAPVTETPVAPVLPKVPNKPIV